MKGLAARAGMLVLAALMLAVLMQVLDTTIANVALPTIARDLNASPAFSIWIAGMRCSAFIGHLRCVARGSSPDAGRAGIRAAFPASR